MKHLRTVEETFGRQTELVLQLLLEAAVEVLLGQREAVTEEVLLDQKPVTKPVVDSKPVTEEVLLEEEPETEVMGQEPVTVEILLDREPAAEEVLLGREPEPEEVLLEKQEPEEKRNQVRAGRDAGSVLSAECFLKRTFCRFESAVAFKVQILDSFLFPRLQ